MNIYSESTLLLLKHSDFRLRRRRKLVFRICSINHLKVCLNSTGDIYTVFQYFNTFSFHLSSNLNYLKKDFDNFEFNKKILR